ncbi:MAG: rRNA cytosine-C5-methyltransferase [Prevotellaceae bacterium]|jgi:16S rRNA C967 or C1407 C5-methylase (RsmB/RsmF family)/NOL1/NOP2/fmu family ribosome biogenesis protein|nr:rRNA cytosine-C5-methyltransferase [Prevotellaceae bacterium]
MSEIPLPFIQSLQNLLGAEAGGLLDALQQAPPVSIRYNRKKTAAGKFVQETPVPWCPDGVYLAQRPAFTLDPLWHGGAYYVQEASSMFLAQLAPALPSLGSRCRVLDLCAAPGGKSTLLAGLLPPESLLVANEPIRSRAAILQENLAKWGSSNVVVTRNDPQQFGMLAGAFDLLLVDAPCSGEGMFRKDAAAMREWSLAHVRFCAERQRRIVAGAWNALREGGLLAYSTCTFNRDENDANVQWIQDTLGAERAPLPLTPAWGVVESEAGYRFYPHRVQGEGFFMSVLRKTSPSRSANRKGNEKAIRRAAAKAPAQVEKWLSGQFVFDTRDNFIHALPCSQQAFIAQLSQHLNVLQAGVAVGEQKGTTIIPAAALALSTALQPTAFPKVEVDLSTALHFLRRDAVKLDGAEKDFVLLTYNHLPLGFVKRLGRRTNNLYPAAWRIRMTVPQR